MLLLCLKPPVAPTIHSNNRQSPSLKKKRRPKDRLPYTGYPPNQLPPFPATASLCSPAETLGPKLCSSGRRWELWVPSPLYVAALGGRFMVRVHISHSYPFQCGYFLICPMCRGHLASSRFPSEWTDPHVAIDSVCLSEKVNSGASYATILD